jgi:hypothetical protein
MGFPANYPFSGHPQTVPSDHDRVVEHEQAIGTLAAGQARIESKLDRLMLWIMGVLASAVVGLILSIFTLLRAKT